MSGSGAVFAAVVARVLALHPEDEQARMLRSPSLTSAGRAYAFASGDDVIVKLPASSVAELVASGGGSPCETRPGHPMREWVEISAPDEQMCLSFVLRARGFVADSAE